MNRSLLGLLALLSMSGCSLRTHPNPFDRTEVEKAAEIARLQLSVKNEGQADVLVYVVEGNGGVPRRLGRVAGYGTELLLIRGDATGGKDVQLLLREFGSERTYKPEAIRAFPGDVIQLSVTPLLTTSHVEVRQGG
jgi:hypothetical protein